MLSLVRSKNASFPFPNNLELNNCADFNYKS